MRITTRDAHQRHGAQRVEGCTAELLAEHLAGIAHLGRDGAVPEHHAEGVHGVACRP
jgi:hypothetical protein